MNSDDIKRSWQEIVRQCADSSLSSAASACPEKRLVSSALVYPVGAQTKPRLTTISRETTIDVKELSGIVAYDPSEYLITAQAGTTLTKLIEALAEHGQHLPFDPLLVNSGSTLGGTVASGISGPGQLLYGSLRDFVMEVEFIDGLGNLVRGGGKVVKNAAGFDFPKLMVGSLGRLGVLTEITLKVLPSPRATQNLHSSFASLGKALQAWNELRRESLPIRMLNLQTDGRVKVQVAGLEKALPDVVSKIHQVVPSDWEKDEPKAITPSALDPQISRSNIIVRVATQPSVLENLIATILSLPGVDAFEVHAGGSILWLGLEGFSALEDLSRGLDESSSSGLVISGPSESPCFIGDCGWQNLATRIQDSIDPSRVFAGF